MAYIVLSADNQPTLYQVPEEVALHLNKLARQFLNAIQNPKSPFLKNMTDSVTGQKHPILCYNEEDFVAWLNRKKQTRDEKIIAVAHAENYALPDEWRNYPHFSF